MTRRNKKPMISTIIVLMFALVLSACGTEANLGDVAPVETNASDVATGSEGEQPQEVVKEAEPEVAEPEIKEIVEPEIKETAEPEEVTVEPEEAKERSREPIIFNSRSERDKYLFNYKEDDLVIYLNYYGDDVENKTTLIPLYDGDTFVIDTITVDCYLCYPTGNVNITSTDNEVNEMLEITDFNEMYCVLSGLGYSKKSEEVTITVSYDDGREYSMTIDVVYALD